MSPSRRARSFTSSALGAVMNSSSASSLGKDSGKGEGELSAMVRFRCQREQSLNQPALRRGRNRALPPNPIAAPAPVSTVQGIGLNAKGTGHALWQAKISTNP